MRKAVFLFLVATLPISFVYAQTGEIKNLSNRRYLDEIVQVIQNAKRSIFMAMYQVPFDPSDKTSPVTRLMEALVEAKARSVSVRVILDQEIKTERSAKGAPMKNLRAYHYLKENGISVSFDSLAKRTHAKLLVIDEETVIVGSTNWSREALNENYEANILVRSPEMAHSFLEDFKTIELLQSETPATTQARLRISRNFLLAKNKGPRLLDGHAERALQLYLILLKASSPSLQIDYQETAQLLGISKMSRSAYRRQIIKVLKKLDRDYGLIRFEPRHGKDAVVTLMDPVPQENYFEIPLELFSFGWLQTLSQRALYAWLILSDQASYARTSPTIKVGLETLKKRYFVSQQTLGEGFRELARENLIEIFYGRAANFKEREFETASYVPLPLYNPKVRDQDLARLEKLYGEYAFEQTRDWARAFFKEKDPAVIETLLGLRLTYSPEWVDLAMKKIILEKDVGNPARSLPYLIGILKQWKEKGRPTLFR